MDRSVRLLAATCVIAFAFHGNVASADDKADYQKRVATRYLDLFQALDRDRDGRVTRVEASGNLNFLPTFADMDIDGDNAVTMAELRRYLELTIGVTTVTASSQ